MLELTSTIMDKRVIHMTDRNCSLDWHCVIHGKFLREGLKKFGCAIDHWKEEEEEEKNKNKIKINK